MGTIIIVLLVLWLVVAVLGFLFKAVLWLGFIGLVLFAATALFGFMQRKSRR